MDDYLDSHEVLSQGDQKHFGAIRVTRDWLFGRRRYWVCCLHCAARSGPFDIWAEAAVVQRAMNGGYRDGRSDCLFDTPEHLDVRPRPNRRARDRRPPTDSWLPTDQLN